MGQIWSGWPQKGFKFGFNSIMYLINSNEPNLNLILGRVGPPRIQIRLKLGQVGPQIKKSGSIWVGLVGFIWLY